MILIFGFCMLLFYFVLKGFYIILNRKRKTNQFEGGSKLKGCCKDNTKSLIIWLEQQLFFTFFITLSQESIIQFLISGILFFQRENIKIDIEPNQITEIASFTLAILCFFFSLVMMPLFSLLILFLNEDYLKPEKVKKVKQMLGALYSNLKTDSRQCFLYNIIFISRRILIGLYAT